MKFVLVNGRRAEGSYTLCCGPIGAHKVRSCFLCSKQWRDAVRVITIALSTVLTVAALLNSTSAQAGTPQGRPADPMAASAQPPSPVIRLAGSFQSSTGKLGDKYMAGQAGGRYGTGGTESVKFPKQTNKSLRQPADDSPKFPKQKS